MDVARLIAKTRSEVARLEDRMDRWACVYCGDGADTRDHLLNALVVPLAARPLVPTVPACRRCNFVLGALAVRGVWARARFVGAYERRKYAKLLRAPAWTQDELDTLKGTLARFVVAKQSDRRRLEARLRNLDAGGVCSPKYGIIDYLYRPAS